MGLGRSVALSIITLQISFASAMAADLRTAPVYKAAPAAVAAYNWSGLYIGGTAGAAWTKADVDLGVVNGSAALYDPAQIPGLQAVASRTLSETDAIFGGKIGFNWQSNMFVYGVEADISSLRFNSANTTTGYPFGVVPPPGIPDFATFDTTVSTTWLSTIRGRAGYAMDRTLIYATGGAAFANVKFSDIYRGHSPLGSTFDNGSAASSQTRFGWAVGGGLDYAFTNNWIISVEYLHVDLGSIDASGLVTTLSPRTSTFNFSTKLTSDIVRGGISYKF